jgi:hypothetical protein
MGNPMTELTPLAVAGFNSLLITDLARSRSYLDIFVATDKNMLSNRRVVNHLILKNVECIFGNFFNFYLKI